MVKKSKKKLLQVAIYMTQEEIKKLDKLRRKDLLSRSLYIRLELKKVFSKI